MSDALHDAALGALSRLHPAIADFFAVVDPAGAKPERRFGAWLADLSDDRLAEIGLDRAQARAHVAALAQQVAALRRAEAAPLRALTVLGGVDKQGRREPLDLTLVPGDVVCVVGPTGSGKSRLLADVECLAQGDTPSGRRILINGAAPDAALRYSAHRKLVAQLSQNMNFVVDLTAGEFVALHAECRQAPAPADAAAQVIACANDLAGERFTADTPVTQLSGGQSRALMIADTALLSASPIVLIDEIENAGVDRKKALDLLIAGEKIVLLSTHDPILALLGARRLAVRGGAVAEVIDTSPAERANLVALQRLDRELSALRARLRAGERIDAPLDWIRA